MKGSLSQEHSPQPPGCPPPTMSNWGAHRGSQHCAPWPSPSPARAPLSGGTSDPPSFSDTFTQHPQGADMGNTQTPRENGHMGQTLFQMASSRWKSFSEDGFCIRGEIGDIQVGQNVPKKVGDLRTDLACPLSPNPNSPNCPPQALYQSHQTFRCPERESVGSLVQTKVYMTDGSFPSEGLNGGI